MRFLGEISNDWPNNVSQINVDKTLDAMYMGKDLFTTAR